MQWTKLLTTPKWMPLSDFPDKLQQLSGNLFRIEVCQYCLGVPYADKTLIVKPAGLFLSALLWSSGDGAALRAANLQLEMDEGLAVLPPTDLLPNCAGNTYQQILEGVKTANLKGISEVASYRIASDGLFIHRSILSEMANYYFRGRENLKDEVPYAIMWKQLPKKNCLPQ